MGPSQHADHARKPFRQVALYAVARDHRHVDEKAQRDDQRCDGDLLKIDSQHIYNAERHRQCDGYGQSHDQRQAPLPKSEQRNDNDENDGFDKCAHEQMDVLLHLKRLVGRVRKNQVGWKNLVKLLESFEFTDRPKRAICFLSRI